MRIPILLFSAILLFAGCDNDMKNQPKYEPLEESAFFEDGRASREPVAGTVARDHLEEDDLLYRGIENGKPANRYPFEINQARLRRGQERFNIFCAVCHDRLGYGNGMVVQRGFTKPSSFHTERLRNVPAGYFFQVITNGFGAMSSYASQIKAEDRWAIAAYIRTLQYSQNVPLDELSTEEQKKLSHEIRTHL